jgi:hypothetical protein
MVAGLDKDSAFAMSEYAIRINERNRDSSFLPSSTFFAIP